VLDTPLTPTSYLVLGLVGHLGECTSYQMKQVVSGSIGYFWSFPHSQLYAEPARLAEAGLLAEEREASGRRRRSYTLTKEGRDVLAAWLAEPSEQLTEIRDLALLKLHFGGQARLEDIVALAEAAAGAHRRRLAEYEAIASRRPAPDRQHLTTLDLGLRYEATVVAFWEEVKTGAERGGHETRPAPTNASQ